MQEKKVIFVKVKLKTVEGSDFKNWLSKGHSIKSSLFFHKEKYKQKLPCCVLSTCKIEVPKSNGKSEWIEMKEGVGGNGNLTKGDYFKLGQEAGAC